MLVVDTKMGGGERERRRKRRKERSWKMRWKPTVPVGFVQNAQAATATTTAIVSL